ncbi:glycosyltransferase [Streptomyces sp. NPDC058691]|uniref:glycosyltransferase n=1 Tax=Streptomyces sp. NPDC058691 TaxID=3346601 RepID=UPI003651D392
MQGCPRACPDSVLSQPVTDRSPDHCGRILDAYAARNTGAERATGDCLFFLDGDDTARTRPIRPCTRRAC